MDTSPLQTLLSDQDIFIPVLFAGVGVVAIVLCKVTSIIKAVSRERTRREIAAYIAEGSMSPEQGERLMKAGHEKA